MALEPPNSLDIAFGDATTVPEQAAWGAYLALQNDLKNPGLADPQALVRERQSLRSYVDERSRYGHQIFPSVTASANKKRNTLLTDLYTKPLSEALPAESFAEIERRAGFTSDPEAFQQRTVNRTFLSATLGKPIPAEQYDSIRQQYAIQNLGLKDDTSDRAVFAAIKAQRHEEADAQKNLTEFAEEAFLKTISGELKTQRLSKEQLSKIPERLRESVSERYSASVRESRRTRRYLTPIVAKLEAGIMAEVKDRTEGTGVDYMALAFNSAAQDLPLNKDDRDVALAMLASSLREKQNMRGPIDRKFVSLLRSFESVGSNSFEQAAAIGLSTRADFDDLVGNQGDAATRRQYVDSRAAATRLRQLYYQEVDPIRDASAKGIIAGIDTSIALSLNSAAYYTLPFAGPAGFGLMAASMGGADFQQARNDNPEANMAAQLNMSFAAGIVNAGIETVFTKVGVKLTFGKLPQLATILNKTGMGSFGRGATAFALRGSAGTAIEYFEEAVQGATSRFTQDMALEFSKVDPETDWGKFWGEWFPAGDAKWGEEQKLTLLAILPFAFVLAGAGSISHFKYGMALAKNSTFLHAMGFNETQTKEIIAQGEPEKVNAAMRAAFKEGLEARTTEEKSQALEVLRAAAKARAEALIPTVTPETNSFTDETSYIYTDPLSRETSTFETEEEALFHWRDQSLQALETDLETILQGANPEALDFLLDEGKSTEGTRVDQMDFVATPQNLVKRGLTTQASIDARIRHFILENGLTAEQTVKTVETLQIKGMAYTQQMRNGQLQYAVRLFQGANPLDIFEEFSETSLKKAINEGIADPDLLVAALITYQSQTGDTLIPTDYVYDPENALPLIEAFSKLSRAHVVGSTNSDIFPTQISKWVNLFTSIAAHSTGNVDVVAQDIRRAGSLRQQIDQGAIPEALLSLLSDSIGINETETLRRLEIHHEAQIIAEAMEGFPEIQEQAAGLLPHPQTLRKNSHPLAGEAQRIYDSLKKPTRRRDKQGRTIDRTNEANAFFLPIGQMVDLDIIRERMVEQGFDFQTPADLLEALDLSISYGKPVYATNSAAMSVDSFSIGPAATAQTLDTDTQVSFALGYAVLAHNAALRIPKASLMERINDEFAKNEADPIAYNPEHYYRFIDGNGWKDAQREGHLRPNPVKDKYQTLFASKGTTAVRYQARYIVEIDPARTGKWGEVSSAKYVQAEIGSVRLDGAVRVFQRNPDGTVEIVLDNIGGDAFLPAQDSFSIASINPLTILPQTNTAPSSEGRGSKVSGNPMDSGKVSIRTPEGVISPEAISETPKSSSLFKSAPSEPGDASPRGDGETDTSFSIGRARENYEKAQNKLLYAKKELSEAEENQIKSRFEWEKEHGTTANLQDVTGYMEGNTYRSFAGYKLSELIQNLRNGRLPENISYFLTGGRPGGSIYGISTRLVEANVIKAELPGFDLVPYLESKEVIAARKYLSQAEADLYLATEEFDPETDARLAIADRLHKKELSKQAATFSALLDARDEEAKQASRSFVAHVWNAFAKHDELFQFGRSKEKSAKAIAKAVSVPGRQITADDLGDTIRFTSSNGSISIMDADTDRPHISASGAASKGKKSGGGSQLYAAALDWIHNNGKCIKDDPAGITAINLARRTSNFVASALRWGTTAHLMPNAAQAVGKWTKSDVLNTSLLLTKEMENAFKAIPEARDWTYDFPSSIFSTNGKPLTETDFGNSVATGKPGESGIGVSTLQRAVITASAIQEFQRGTTADSLAPEQLPDSLVATSYSLSPQGINRLEAAIASKLTAAPIERAQFYERLRNRIAGLTQQLEDMENGIGVFARKPTDEIGEERRRIQDAIAEAKAVVSALPMDARGRVSIDFTDITSKSTEKGRIKALLRLIADADAALEIVLKKEYLSAFEKLLDLAAPDLRQNRQIRGRLTPETQRLVNAVLPLIHLTPNEASASLIAAQAAYDAVESQYPDPTDQEAVTAWESALAKHQEHADLLNTFASLMNGTSAEIAEAHKQLLSIYTRGRTARQILDQNKRQETASMRRELIDSLGGLVSQPKWSRRTKEIGFKDKAQSALLGMSSFHQVAKYLFPDSAVMPVMLARLRTAERDVTRQRILSRKRFEEFGRNAFNLTGKRAIRKLHGIIANLSTRRDDWNIEIAEGTKWETEKMSEEQAASILDGTLKPGWESDLIAMESLRQSLADFRLQRLTAQNDAKAFTKSVIRFQRLTTRGAPAFLEMSDMEALYYLQLADQEQYLPTLDRYGLTASVLKTIRKKIDPRATTFGKHLRTEYDAQWGRLNPVHQAIYGLDMPRIRNYAPGMFESMNSNSNVAPEGEAPAVNAMSTGFTKARTHHMARPKQSNALLNYWTSMETTEYFIAYGELMRDMRQIFRSPDVRRTIEGNYGIKAANDFSTWLDVLEIDGRVRALKAQFLAETTQNVLSSQSAIGLAFNAGSVLKQVSAGSSHLIEIPLGPGIKATAKAVANPKILKLVWESESIQQRIEEGISPEDKRLLSAAHAASFPGSKVSTSEIVKWFNAESMYRIHQGRMPIAWGDAVSTTLTGSAAYQYQYDRAIASGLSDSQAHQAGLEFMDQVITNTAQPATTQDKSLNEITATGAGGLLKIFRSDPRQKLAISANAIALASRGKISWAEAGRRLFVAWALYGIMGSVLTIIARAVLHDDDDPDEWTIRDLIAGAIAGPISGFGLIGGIIETTIQSTIGTGGFVNSANPLDKSMATTLRTVTGLLNGDELTIRDAHRAAAAAAQIGGAFNPNLAIIPAFMRILRDSNGLAGNIGDVLFDESEEEVQRRIIREERSASREKSTDRTAALDSLADRLISLPPDQREARLKAMDSETRARVLPRVRKASMTPEERALAAMSLAARRRTVDRILENLPEKSRQPFLDRIEKIGISLPD